MRLCFHGRRSSAWWMRWWPLRRVKGGDSPARRGDRAWAGRRARTRPGARRRRALPRQEYEPGELGRGGDRRALEHDTSKLGRGGDCGALVGELTLGRSTTPRNRPRRRSRGRWSTTPASSAVAVLVGELALD